MKKIKQLDSLYLETDGISPEINLNFEHILDKLNELVDAVNEMVGQKTK